MQAVLVKLYSPQELLTALILFQTDYKVFKKDDEVIVSQLEHHSNIVPWQMLCEKTGAIMKVIR